MTLRRLTSRTLPILATGILLALPAPPAGAQHPAGAQSALADMLLADGMTRGEMAKGLVGALQVVGFQPPACVPGEELFDDVPASSPFCPFVEALARSGITGGCGGDNFCPGDPVTRQQMAVFVVRTLEATLTASAYTVSDEDVLLELGSFTEVLSTSITVPPGGRTVTAFATLDAVSAGPNGSANCRVVIGESAGINQVSRNGDNIRQNMALTHATALPGGSHPVVLECAQGGSDLVEVQERTLSALATGPIPPE